MEINNIREEIVDRFGKIPLEVENLLKIVIIEADARDIGIKEIFQEGKRVFFSIDKKNTLSLEKVELFLNKGKKARFGEDYLSFETGKDIIVEVLNVLNILRGERNYAKLDY